MSHHQIKTQIELYRTIIDIVKKGTALSEKVTSAALLVESVCVYTHSADEYESLVNILTKMGRLIPEQDTSFHVELLDSIEVGDQTITHIYLEKPSPFYLQVGACFFAKEDMKSFPHRANHLVPYIQTFEKNNEKMLQIFDLAKDVVVYVKV